MNRSKKYGRTLHAPISLGATADDRVMPKGYLKKFSEMSGLILTEKLDGQNNCLNKYGVFARSHATPSEHPWDQPLRDRWQLIKKDLKELEIFGENMFAVHAIEYSRLESFFYVFAICEGSRWLSWEEVKFYAAMLEFPTVPALPVKESLKNFYDEAKSEDEILEKWLQHQLGFSWQAYVESPGLLGGVDTQTGKPASEGLVVRLRDAFDITTAGVSTATNEFGTLFKLVRASHVGTDKHWTKNWDKAKLIDYEKYGWESFSYLSKER